METFSFLLPVLLFQSVSCFSWSILHLIWMLPLLEHSFITGLSWHCEWRLGVFMQTNVNTFPLETVWWLLLWQTKYFYVPTAFYHCFTLHSAVGKPQSVPLLFGSCALWCGVLPSAFVSDSDRNHLNTTLFQRMLHPLHSCSFVPLFKMMYDPSQERLKHPLYPCYPFNNSVFDHLKAIVSSAVFIIF